jgi:ornithine decarboxylase
MDELTNLVQEHNVRVFSDSESTEDIIAALIADRLIDDAPVFVVDIGAVKRSYERWQELLPNVKVHFAMKSNADPVIIQTLAALGSCFDVASHNEISAALQHVSPDRLVYAHPVKDNKTLSYARQVDVDLLTFDSENELLKVALFHPQALLMLRLKVDDTGSACRFSTKFGAEWEDVAGLLSLARTLHLNVVGFSFHVGSGAVNPQLYLRAMEMCLEAMQLARDVGMSPSIIDIGGGFQSSSFESFADVIRPFVSEHSDYKFIAEPGRLLVNDAATLVISVIGKKRVQNADGETTYVIYANESVYGLFNNTVFDHRSILLEPFNEREGDLFKTKVFGRTCDSIDVITEECMLPDLAVGERLFVRSMGAYTSASAASAFNGFENPQTVYVLTTV